jgi:hypothetical protein
MYIADLLGTRITRHREPPPPGFTGSATGVGRLRKIALIGSAQTLDHAPWYDPTWEIWAHATCHNLCVRVDRFFDLHPWEWIVGKQVPGYLDFLKKTKVPVYLQQRRHEVPSSYTYPKERILAEHRRYFTNHMAWMSALALSEGVTHLALWGIHYEHDIEHERQRGCCEYWIGFLEGRGVHVVIPEANPVCKNPPWLYGYESHEDAIHKRATTNGASPTVVKPHTSLVVVPETQTSTLHPRADVEYDTERWQAGIEGRVPMIAGKPAW